MTASYFTDEQVGQLLRPLNPRRVTKRAEAGKTYSYLESYDVRAHLDRVIGFARWSADLVELVELYAEYVEKTYPAKDNKPERKAWVHNVAYRATVRLTICAPDGTQLATYTEAAAGDAAGMPDGKRSDAHDFAIKTAESQALKRCAINLGTQYGLSLYAGGATNDIVGRTLITGTTRSAETAIDEAAPPVVEESEAVPARDDQHEQSAAPEPAPPARDSLSDEIASLVAQLSACKTKSQVGMVSADIGKRKLTRALTADGRTLSAVLDEALKRVHSASAA